MEFRKRLRHHLLVTICFLCQHFETNSERLLSSATGLALMICSVSAKQRLHNFSPQRCGSASLMTLHWIWLSWSLFLCSHTRFDRLELFSTRSCWKEDLWLLKRCLKAVEMIPFVSRRNGGLVNLAAKLGHNEIFEEVILTIQHCQKSMPFCTDKVWVKKNNPRIRRNTGFMRRRRNMRTSRSLPTRPII